ncbi:hypothetical protein [Streptomyces litchfieldiae]|uniref:Secreted protein n=1 Tax=Streptomyces litchfieldiae TaxID=3075543 RepID=A0ABU2MPG3_9ACTN|nr:hypothetical protein [Streptomyces sp. DSM 44938]MDT0343287.1 hypothetical protein [Streptomyces sp. DSM 44938]
MRGARIMTGVALAAATAFGGGVVFAPGAVADPADCQIGWGQVTCPAGAGDFTFRAVADCYDTYPNPSYPNYIGTYEGPWVTVSPTESTSSSIGPCHGYVPGSGVALNTRIEVR